jgi:hypothetical protein
MLVLLRILFGAALLYELIQGARIAPSTIPVAGDVTGAFYLAVCIGLGILNAVVWAPYIGSAVSGPLTGVITESTYVERVNWILRCARWLENRAWRRTAVWICFWEAVRHPSSPAPFVMGFRNARPGSWFEKVFAREVFRLNNIQNCVQAYLALKRHGIDPRPHPTQEINIVLLSLERQPRPEAAKVRVPPAAKPAALQRNPRIRLFKRAETAAAPELARDSDPIGSAPPSEAGEALEVSTASDVGPQSERPAPVHWFSSMLARVVAFLRAQ